MVNILGAHNQTERNSVEILLHLIEYTNDYQEWPHQRRAFLKSSLNFSGEASLTFSRHMLNFQNDFSTANYEQLLLKDVVIQNWKPQTQPAFTYSKLTIETLEQGVKYVQS